MPASDAGLWDSTDTYGSFSTSDDFKSQKHMDVLATDILIKESGTIMFCSRPLVSLVENPSKVSSLLWDGMQQVVIQMV